MKPFARALSRPMLEKQTLTRSLDFGYLDDLRETSHKGLRSYRKGKEKIGEIEDDFTAVTNTSSTPKRRVLIDESIDA